MSAAKDLTAQQTQAHYAELVNNYNKLVRRIAYRVLRKLPQHQISVELDDLINIGMIGLFEADGKFNPDAGQSFESFAEFRIRGAMLDELRKRDFFPRRLRAKANRLQRAEKTLKLELGRDATEEELAEKMDMSVDALIKLQHETMPYSFVDQSDPTIQLRADEPSSFQHIAEQQRQEVLTELLETLPKREQIILDLYFNQEISQREIAQMLDLTEGRISQIKSMALEKLRLKVAQLEI